MSDIRTCLGEGAERLARAGIDNPRREARLLLAHATGLSEAVLIGYPERKVVDGSEFFALVERRAAREPFSHLIGRREFWSLAFEVTADTLDPRADSETLIEAAIECRPDANAALRILDLGTGTGCLLAALLTVFPASWGIGVDRNQATAAVARRNLTRLGLGARGQIVVADWANALSGRFDLVIANPPYIPTGGIAALQPEVAGFEPALALDGGPDGLASLRRVMDALPALLMPGAAAIVEFGDGQRDAVRELAAESGLKVGAVKADLGDRPRCVVCGL